MDVSKYEIEIKRHVFIQAIERGIHSDIIEEVLRNGELKRYGKHGVKFINKGNKRTIICIGQIIGIKIKIFTIEEEK